MENLASSNTQQCCREDILLYLDCEMSSQEELAFEEHIAICKDCHAELNEHKKMLSALNLAFEEDSVIEPPKNFAKIVAVRAESGVGGGLRHPKERPLALLFCLFMALLVVAGIAMGSEGLFSVAAGIGEKFFSVLGFVFHFIYDICLGIAIVLRSLTQQSVFFSYSLGGVSVLLLFLILMAGYVFRLALIRR